jgi:hypothetical protein
MEAVARSLTFLRFRGQAFYLGGALGWIQTDPKYTTGALLLGAPFVITSGSDKNGVTYGILAGYNYQVGQLVVGVEADQVTINLCRNCIARGAGWNIFPGGPGDVVMHTI